MTTLKTIKVVAGLVLLLGLASTSMESQVPPALDSYGDPLPPGALFRMGTTRMRQGGAPKTVAWSPDGTLVVCASSGIDRAVRIFEAVTGKEVLVIDKHRNRSQAAAFSPDGKLVASLDQTGILYLWDAATGAAKGVRNQAVKNTTVTFAADGKSLAAIDKNGQACLVEVPSLQTARVFDGEPGQPAAQVHITISRDGKILVAADANNAVRCYDTEKGTVLWKVLFPDKIHAMSLSRDGTLLAAVGEGSPGRIWSAATGKLVTELANQEGTVKSLDWSPDGKTLATGSTDNKARLWDVRTGKEVMVFVHPHAFAAGQGNVPCVAFSPDGKLVASTGMDGDNVVHIWSAQTGKKVLDHDAHLGFVSALVVLDQGKTLLTSAADDSIRLWDLASGKPRGQFQAPHYRAQAIAVTPDGKRMALGNSDGAIRFLELPEGKVVNQIRGDKSPVSNLAFSPDGKRLVSSSNNSKLLLWDLETGKVAKQLNHPKDSVQTIAFSPDGKMICTGSNKGFVALWDGNSGQEIVKLAGHTDRVDHVQFLADNKQVVTVSIDASVRVWNVLTGKEVRLLKHRAPVFCVAVSPDGKMLATAAGDGVIHLWEIATGQERAHFDFHRGRVWVLAFLKDGKTFISGCTDSTALCWDGRGLGNERAGKRLSAEELQVEWDCLFGAKVDRAYQALWALAEHREQALEKLKTVLRPTEKMDSKQIDKWIADLDANDFEVREKGSDELIKAGVAALPALKKALEKPASAEAQFRLKQILGNPDDPLTSNDQRLRLLRSLELLERLETPGARALVQELSNGVPESWLTQEAKAMMKRME